MAATVIGRWIVCTLPLITIAIMAQTYNSPTAVCRSSKPDHSDLSGEALYQAILNDYLNVTKQMSDIAALNHGKPINNDTGFFLSVILRSDAAAQLILDIASGKAPINFDNCYSLLSNSATVVNAVILHANDTISGGTCDQLTGEARYQYLLQQTGQFYLMVFNIADRDVVNPNPYAGTYLKTLINVATGSRNMLKLWAMVEDGTAGAFNRSACEFLTQAVGMSSQPEIDLPNLLGKTKTSEAPVLSRKWFPFLI